MKATLKDLYQEAWLRQRERGLILWTTKEGKDIPINEMSDAHLVNTINMLLRNEAKAEEERELREKEWDHMGDYDPLMEMLKD